MYEKKILFFILLSILFIGCKSTRILSDDGERITEYRELESEIRDGETELAITSTNISNNGREIETTSSELERQLQNLGESIGESTNNQQGIGEILQQIRDRELTENQLVELGIIRKD